jgi:hypothetical protein
MNYEDQFKEQNIHILDEEESRQSSLVKKYGNKVRF